MDPALAQHEGGTNAALAAFSRTRLTAVFADQKDALGSALQAMQEQPGPTFDFAGCSYTVKLQRKGGGLLAAKEERLILDSCSASVRVGEVR